MRNGFFWCNRILEFILVAMLSSCSTTNTTDEPIEDDIVPTNMTWSIKLIGSDKNTPNGDGSGMILCKAFAENAVRYGLKIDDRPELENTTGEYEYTFKKNGINKYTVRVSAYSSTGNIISVSNIIEILVIEGEEQAQDSNMVWSDEFDSDGPVSTDNWFSETVPPNNGSWFNAEQQHYTNRVDNAYVSNGTLKIVAKKEKYTAFNSTKNYTSARLNSKFSFTYGRIEIRAKLPAGGGTWPAIWTLGSNITSVGWPSCGEIDIMEHVGNNVGKVSSAIQTPASHGNTVNVEFLNIENATIDFHVYVVDWTSDKMDFYVDDRLFYTYNPTVKNSATWPFDANQFILLNIAMGGTLGGNIASEFNSATMEIDYVRVFQKVK
ncbi:glycoside hydrolase family 16 protein [Pareuzebyella sediminis]|uniref:glycoside hydrolase family 16 protein n=1 Tax=Pareuzebyella sediminis TaxID=2607998 RepID=UPI0011ECDAAE|nr:glycoside hydrolase family 16 protein [Pareuzebyella sediminis]